MGPRRALAVGVALAGLFVLVVWVRRGPAPETTSEPATPQPTAPAKLACKGGGSAAFSCLVSSSVARRAVPCATLRVSCPDGVHEAKRCGDAAIEPFGVGTLTFELGDFQPPFRMASGKCTRLDIPKTEIQMR